MITTSALAVDDILERKKNKQKNQPESGESIWNPLQKIRSPDKDRDYPVEGLGI